MAAKAAGKSALTEQELADILDGYRDMFKPFLTDWSLPTLKNAISGIIVDRDTVGSTEIFCDEGVSLYVQGIYDCSFPTNDQRIKHIWGLGKDGLWLRIAVEPKFIH